MFLLDFNAKYQTDNGILPVLIKFTVNIRILTETLSEFVVELKCQEIQ